MLFKTIDEFRDFIVVNKSTDFNSIKNDIRRAEKKYLIPQICQAQYDALEAAYQANSMTTEQTNLLEYCREVVAAFAMHLYLPLAQVQISDSGVRLHHTDSHVTAFQWQIDDLNEKYFLHPGHVAIDRLITYMDANSSSYPIWVASDCYCVNKEAIITNYRDFNNAYYIQNSPTTYYALLPIMKRIEMLTISDAICPALYERIKSEIKAGAISAEIKDLQKWLHPAVANLTIARALEEMYFTVRHDGIIVNQYRPNGKDNNRERIAANLEVAKRVTVDSCKYLAQMKLYLDGVATDTLYPEYLECSETTETEETTEDPCGCDCDCNCGWGGSDCSCSSTKGSKFVSI